MLTIPPAVRIFMAVEPADMRRSFDGLALLAREKIEENPLSGHLFVFRNRRGDRMKILFWGVSRTRPRDSTAVLCRRWRLRPSGFSLQEANPNHLKLLRSKGVVVSVQEKSPGKVTGEC